MAVLPDVPEASVIGEAVKRPSWRVWAAVVLLTVAYTLSYVDRQVLSLLVGPIKASLGITDSQLGLIQSVSFSLFFILATLPLARAADRGSRPLIMAWCAGIWSVMTMLCGAAHNMWHLMLARIGVAATEAGLPPSGLTLMADLLDRKHLARATSIFLLAPFFGGGFALLGGGALYEATAGWSLPIVPFLGQIERWQVVFFIVGAPGLVVAVLLAFLPEPRRMQKAAAKTPVEQPGLKELGAFVFGNWRFSALFMLATSLLVLLLNAHIAWAPAAIMRAHDLPEGRMGLMFGLTYLTAGAGGTLIAGTLAGRLHEDMLGRILKGMMLAALVLAPAASLAPLMQALWAEIALLGLAVFCTSGILAVSSLPFQFAAPKRLRAQVLALNGILASLIGAGVGPLSVAVISDHLTGVDQPLSVALSIVGGCTAPLIALVLWQVSRAHNRLRLDRIRLAQDAAEGQA